MPYLIVISEFTLSLIYRQLQSGTFSAKHLNMAGELKNIIKDIEIKAILKALEECNWVQSKAAVKLKITERMFRYRINKYGIKKKEDE